MLVQAQRILIEAIIAALLNCRRWDGCARVRSERYTETATDANEFHFSRTAFSDPGCCRLAADWSNDAPHGSAGPVVTSRSRWPSLETCNGPTWRHSSISATGMTTRILNAHFNCIESGHLIDAYRFESKTSHI